MNTAARVRLENKLALRNHLPLCGLVSYIESPFLVHMIPSSTCCFERVGVDTVGEVTKYLPLGNLAALMRTSKCVSKMCDRVFKQRLKKVTVMSGLDVIEIGDILPEDRVREFQSAIATGQTHVIVAMYRLGLVRLVGDPGAQYNPSVGGYQSALFLLTVLIETAGGRVCGEQATAQRAWLCYEIVSKTVGTMMSVFRDQLSHEISTNPELVTRLRRALLRLERARSDMRCFLTLRREVERFLKEQTTRVSQHHI